MALDSMQEIFDAAAAEHKEFWEIVLETDMDQREVTREQSFEKMRATWRAMLEADDTYRGDRRSASGLAGGDGKKMRCYTAEQNSLSGDFLAEVIATALCTGESNACMRKIVAAPTAGLHFTPELIERLKAKGIGWATVELEVGIDTFRLVEEDDPTQHVMHTERYHVTRDVIDAVHATKAAGHRVVAVGTTAVRSLESAFDAEAPAAEPPMVARGFAGREDSADTLGRGDIVVRENATTQLYLMPGSTYHVVDALITNFHVPRSTLMMLVSALATHDQIMDAYAAAMRERYRFLSFGDAMLIE